MGVSLSARIVRQTSTPLMSGSMRSSRTTSGLKLANCLQAGGAVLGIAHAVAGLVQVAAQGVAELWLVLDHEDSGRRSRRARVADDLGGKPDHEGRPRWGALDAHAAAAELDEALHDGQAKAAALDAPAVLSGAIEALEDERQVLWRDAGSFV